jgi:cytidylate kinase
VNSFAPILTIDGPSGSGKGTVAQLVAGRLGWNLLDSGALYRVVGLLARREGLSLNSPILLAELALKMPLTFDEQGRALVEGEDVGQEIRSETAGNDASKVAAVPEVRQALLEWQRSYVKSPGLVADGRDMGSVVFPDAEVKIYLTADAEERALRRYKQLIEKGMDVSLSYLAAEIRERDERDRNRSVAPLVVPVAALVVESTHLTIDEVVERVMGAVFEALPHLKNR